MERLTERLNDGTAAMNCGYCEIIDACTCLACRNMLKDRLAAYEDTGLTPEQIATVAGAAAMVRSTMGERTLEWLVEKLQEGRVRVIPGRPGDLYRSKGGELVELSAIHISSAPRQMVILESEKGLTARDEVYFRRNFTKQEAMP